MNIAVYCSSSNHIPESYKKAASRLGHQLVGLGHTLVYGGATGGLMDAVAEGAKSGNGQIIGVIAQAIIEMKRLSVLPTELVVVESMSDRKRLMRERSDAFVVLPGSFGTLDEMMDVVAGGVVGEHKKPLILVNENGFYDFLLQQVERMKEELFIPGEESYKIIIVPDIEGCLEQIQLFATRYK